MFGLQIEIIASVVHGLNWKVF